MAIPTLFEQLQGASSQPATLPKKRFNPRPAGVIRNGSASDQVLATLLEHGGLNTEAQIRWKTGLNHTKASWALLYLRRNGFVTAVRDGTRCGRNLRYRAIKEEVVRLERLAGEGDKKPKVQPSESAPPRRTNAQPTAFENVATKEPPRTCASCDQLTAGHSCAAVCETGVSTPSANTPRRCLSYQPKWGADDDRGGRQLWPEIVNFVELGEGAKGFLATALLDGPVPSSEIIARALASGISERSIQRAAEQLGVTREKSGFSGGWIWAMPNTEGAKV